jgi:hypothetical protein
MQSWDIFVTDRDGSCPGISVGRNPEDLNRSFVIHEKKNTHRRYYSLWWSVCGLWYWDAWARYRPGEGVGVHVTWHAEVGNPPLSVIPPHNERATVRLFYSHGEGFSLRFSVLWRCSGWICLFTIERRLVMSACVHVEGGIGQTYDEIRAKFALPFNKTFPKVGDWNKLRNNTSVMCPVLDLN